MTDVRLSLADKVREDLKEVTRILGTGSCETCKWLNTDCKCENRNSPIYGDYPFVKMLCRAYEEGEVEYD